MVDEQGNEIRDRYYKIGSTIDITCQVAITYIANNASSIPEPNILLHRLQQTQSPLSAFSVKENEIDVPEKMKSSTNDSIYRRIVWKKDGENVTKDALFNHR